MMAHRCGESRLRAGSVLPAFRHKPGVGCATQPRSERAARIRGAASFPQRRADRRNQMPSHDSMRRALLGAVATAAAVSLLPLRNAHATAPDAAAALADLEARAGGRLGVFAFDIVS